MSEETKLSAEEQRAQDIAARKAELDAKRAKRKAAQNLEYQEQRLADVEALDALEQEHGDSSVKALDVHYVPGLPTLIVCRAAKPIEMQRYRETVAPRKDRKGHDVTPDYAGAAEQLASRCRIYPDEDTYAKLRDAQPGIHVQLGLAALDLASARESAEGKD